MDILLNESDQKISALKLTPFGYRREDAISNWLIARKMQVVHFKDMVMNIDDKAKSIMAEVGEGNLSGI